LDKEIHINYEETSVVSPTVPSDFAASYIFIAVNVDCCKEVELIVSIGFASVAPDMAPSKYNTITFLFEGTIRITLM
jgi:hypothetical protein